MLCNTNNEDDDMLSKWCLYMIKMMLKLRSADIISYYSDNIVDKCMQVINLMIKEHRNLLLLMHHKMKRNFLLNWVTQLLKCLTIVVILIFNNVAVTDVVTDMF